MTEERKTMRFDKETLVPIGLLVAVVLSSISATVWINTTMVSLRYGVEDVTKQVRRVDERVTDIQSQMMQSNTSRWTALDMMRWVQLANARNTSLNLPEPK